MEEDVFEEYQERINEAKSALARELSKIRTGRANLSILDGIRVSYYGTSTPLNQVAALAVPDARMITIKPWEKHMVGEIEKEIMRSDLGLNPASDGELIRLAIPQLTEERRRNLAKMVRKAGEDAKISVRNARRDANENLKSFKKDGDISEDDMHRALEQVQKKTDESIKQVDDIIKKKEDEILND